MSLIKIVRLKRLERVITYLQMDNVARKRIRIFYLIIRIVMICHWVACSFYKMTNDKWTEINQLLTTMNEKQKEVWIHEGKIKWDY